MNLTQSAPIRDESTTQPVSSDATARHIRGSSLLLVGKFIAQALDFGSQILLIRYLTKADYGAFSYALSFALLCKGIAMFGLPDTLSRYIPVYREKQQSGAIMGALVMAFGLVAGIGILIATALNLGVNVLHIRPTDDPRALMLLGIMAFLIPVEALDGLFSNLFAAFANPRVIFFRQSILTPSLRMGLVLLLTVLKTDVVFLAEGYLAISVLGVLLYAVMFVRILREQGMLHDFHLRRFVYPFREILSFAIPLLASVLVWLLIESSDALLLGYFQNTEAVATFRAVLPMARLNQGVILTFALLYTPLAAHLYARDQHKELGDLYWQTALWMTILSVPIFVMTFSFSRSMITVLGNQYDASVPIMALLSFGYFFHTSLGFNGLTLKVYKRLRFTVAIDISAAVLNVVVNLILIPRWGPLGAAVGSASTLFVHNLLKQYGLYRYTGISLFRRRYATAYGSVIVVSALLLVLQQHVLPTSLWVALPVGAIGSLVVLAISWPSLEIGKMFPELENWPVIRSVLNLSVRKAL